MSEWKRVKLRDCVEEVDERTTENNQYEILTSSKSGIYSQEDYYDKQVASKNNTGYKIIKRGQLNEHINNGWTWFYRNKFSY